MGKEQTDLDSDELISRWEQKLAGYEIVACTERWNQLPESMQFDLRPYVAGSFNFKSAALFVSFDGLMERRYTAFLIPDLMQVAVYYEKDGELFDEFIGVMGLADFWDFLASFPNVYAHLLHNALKKRVH